MGGCYFNYSYRIDSCHYKTWTIPSVKGVLYSFCMSVRKLMTPVNKQKKSITVKMANLHVNNSSLNVTWMHAYGIIVVYSSLFFASINNQRTKHYVNIQFMAFLNYFEVTT